MPTIAKNSQRMPHVAVYARVSTEEQSKEGYSIQVQPQQCIEELEKRFGPNGFTHEVFTDAGKSGSSGPRPWEAGVKKKGDRKGLACLIEGIRAGRFTHIIALRRDRIFRNLANWLAFKEIWIKPYGIKVLFVLEQDEEFTPAAELASGVIAQVAQFELEKTRENVRNALRKRVQQGYKLGVAPFGWRPQHPDEVEPGKRKTIVPVPEELAMVREVKDWYLAGMSYAQIAHKLNELGVPRQKVTSKKWENSTVRILLGNPTHAGLIENEVGELVPGEFYESRAYDPEGYYRIQQVKTERTRRFKGLAATEPHRLFAKTVSCGICGQALRSTYQGDQWAYRCNERRAGPAKGHVYISATMLEKAVITEVERVSQLPEVLAKAEEHVREHAESDGKKLEAEVRRLKRHLADLDRKKDHLRDAVIRGEIRPHEFQPLSDRIDEERSGPLESVAAIEAQLKNRLGHEETCRRALEALRSFPTLWQNLTDTEKRELLRILVEKAVLTKDDREMWLELKLKMLDEVRIFLPRRAIDGRYERPVGPLGLTERQLAILWHVLRGREPAEIAAHMCVTENSIKETGYRIQQHLGVHDLASAARVSRDVVERYERFLPLEGAYFQKRNSLRVRVTEYRVLKGLAAGEALDALSRTGGIAQHRLERALTKALAKMGTDDPKEALRLAAERDLLPIGLRREAEDEKDTD